MKKILKSFKTDDRMFAFIISITFCILIFSVFIGQALWSDIVTFRKNGDDLKQCFPALIKIAEYMENKILWGIDSGSFNGATEFFVRSNLPNMYAPVIFFGFLTDFIPAIFSYFLLYMLQMYVCFYFSLRLAQRFFFLDRRRACLFACSVALLALYENWYLSHYLVTTLICPVLYAELCALENKRKFAYILFALPYVLSFTSGYITTSVTLCIFVLIITMTYGIFYKKSLSKKTVIIRSLIPFIIGGCVSFTYCLQLLLYMKNVVKNESSAIFDTLSYKLSAFDLKNIFSTSFISENPIEQIILISIGSFWVFIIFAILYYKVIPKMKSEEQIIIKLGLIVNVLIVAISLGITLPFVLWFYSFVPVFGSMHLPMRYMMITLVLFYLGLSIAIGYIPDLKNSKIVKYLLVVSLALALILTMSKTLAPIILKINCETMIVELLLLSFIFYLIYNYGLMNNLTIFVCCLFILLPGIHRFYAENEVSTPNYVIKERSIVYDKEKQKKLDEFISTLGKKDRYMYAAFDSVDTIPNFFVGNYEWYDYSKYQLSNYMGYELQLCLPKDYLNKFPWFNRLDYRYIVDTRGDFLVLDDNSIQENQEILNVIVDWDNSNTYLNNTNRICKLNKFVPSYYTGEDFVLDRSTSMDNGYFYSYDLQDDALISFSTNDSTYYAASINANSASTVAFLLYPNRFYHYYVNGVEINPIINDMKVYIPIDDGLNEIYIVYKNGLAQFGIIIFVGFYLLCSLISIYYICIKIHSNKLRVKNRTSK